MFVPYFMNCCEKCKGRFKETGANLFFASHIEGIYLLGGFFIAGGVMFHRAVFPHAFVIRKGARGRDICISLKSEEEARIK
jgi:hypothetical protein